MPVFLGSFLLLLETLLIFLEAAALVQWDYSFSETLFNVLIGGGVGIGQIAFLIVASTCKAHYTLANSDWQRAAHLHAASFKPARMTI